CQHRTPRMPSQSGSSPPRAMPRTPGRADGGRDVLEFLRGRARGPTPVAWTGRRGGRGGTLGAIGGREEALLPGVALAAAVAGLAAAGVAQAALLPANGDASWYLYVAGRVLDGRTPY